MLSLLGWYIEENRRGCTYLDKLIYQVMLWNKISMEH